MRKIFTSSCIIFHRSRYSRICSELTFCGWLRFCFTATEKTGRIATCDLNPFEILTLGVTFVRHIVYLCAVSRSLKFGEGECVRVSSPNYVSCGEWLIVLLLYNFYFVCIISIFVFFFGILCLIFFTVSLVRSWCHWDAVYSVFYFFLLFLLCTLCTIS